ncbi:MAG: FAD-binding oxidoreductase [Thermomicrobiales bacterium]
MAIQTTPRILNQEVFTPLAEQLRGNLVLPGDPEYDEACVLYNSMIEKHPAAVARCHDAADVIGALRFAREQGLTVAVRGGAHNVAGKGSADDAIVIDLSEINDVHVDPRVRTARVGGGAVWGDVDHATHAFGLATPSGIISTTGVGGLTLGGGFGHLTRHYGLTIDNLLEADMVLADGSFVTVNETESPDLFWAIRGGGGNFGIVTSFTFRLHEVGDVYGGPIFYPAEKATEMMEFYREWMNDAPRETSAFFGYHQGAPAPFIPEELHFIPAALFMICHSGDVAKGEEAARPFRELAEPALDLAGPLPYPAIQTMFDDLYHENLCHYWKSDIINELPDEAIEIHAKRVPEVPDPWSGAHIYPLNGAVHDRDPEDTAWPFRDAFGTHNLLDINPDPAVVEERIPDLRQYHEELRSYSDPGGYVNFMADQEGDARVRAAYRGNYDRLVEIKRKYDPDNVFHCNQNIKP